MPAPTTEEKLDEVREVIAGLNASIKKLSGKTNQSVSFGDQSFGLADIEKLVRVRDRYREEERVLEGSITGGKRRTIKIHFPSC